MQDKEPYNEQGRPHGFWDISLMDGSGNRACGNVVNGVIFGYWVLYQNIDNLIINKRYYAR